MKKNNYIEHLKRKGYIQLSDIYFETSDGFLFQYVEKIENGHEIKHLIMIGRYRKIDNKWCDKNCEFLCSRNDNEEGDVSCGDVICFCNINQRYIGFREDVDAKECECVSSGTSIEPYINEN